MTFIDGAQARALAAKWRTLAYNGLRSSGTWAGNDIADRMEYMADELEALAAEQQPAAVDEAMGAKLTEVQRTRLVEKLVADQVESANRVSLYLWDVLESGFKGYANYTDQELLDAHSSAFDEDFLDLESGELQ